ncbi:MAG: enterochelin esterase [Candidatus Eremiobacteraeota bacterium]|nr:enterochelin esterase [Candidatus Eremiobacteraeota bacterium]
MKCALPLLLAVVFAYGDAAVASPATETVTVKPSAAVAREKLAGRMLVFVAPAKGKHPPKDIEPEFVGNDVDIVGFDVDRAAGASIQVPADATAYPTALSALKPGTYDALAVLDRNGTYAYAGIGDGDLVGTVHRIRLEPGATVPLDLTHRVSEPPPRSTADVRVVDVPSPLLSGFYGRPITLHATVVLPIGYDARQKYPIVYVMTGFGGTYEDGFHLAKLRQMMNGDSMHALVVVADSTAPTGIAQFADSANNGPWGRAFTTEFVPSVERLFPAQQRAATRFLWGHSSGGWSTLWLQLNYPSLFGGTWSSSPDPVDFHDFTGPDLVSSPPDNFYTDRWNRPWQLVRMGTANVLTVKQFVQMSDAEGFTASQYGSFDAVFSPRGTDGKPQALFDHQTGAVNREVAAYWEQHYDICTLIAENWPTLEPTVARKVHVAVGTLDTFHLERGVLRLDARVRQLGVTPDVTYFKDASHFSPFRPSTGYEGFHWAFRGIAKAIRQAR